MKLDKADLPYLYEDAGTWETLPNGIERQQIWDYTIVEATVRAEIDQAEQPIIREQVRHRLNYRCGDYRLSASAVDTWLYLEQPESAPNAVIMGYRGYWEGEVCQGEAPTLQPEVAIMLGLTDDFTKTPPYIETVSQAQLLALLQDAQERFKNDDALAFSRALPIGAPPNAPASITDSLRRMRAQTHLLITRGRAALLDLLLEQTGCEAVSGGWRVLPTEIERRRALGLR